MENSHGALVKNDKRINIPLQHAGRLGQAREFIESEATLWEARL